MTCPCPRILECPHIHRHQILANILTAQEIRKIQESFENYILPWPRGWAHALLIYGIKSDITTFSPDRTYTATDLTNLHSTLREVSLDDEEILIKIAQAAKKLQRRGCRHARIHEKKRKSKNLFRQRIHEI